MLCHRRRNMLSQRSILMSAVIRTQHTSPHTHCTLITPCFFHSPPHAFAVVAHAQHAHPSTLCASRRRSRVACRDRASSPCSRPRRTAAPLAVAASSTPSSTFRTARSCTGAATMRAAATATRAPAWRARSSWSTCTFS